MRRWRPGGAAGVPSIARMPGPGALRTSGWRILEEGAGDRSSAAWSSGPRGRQVGQGILENGQDVIAGVQVDPCETFIPAMSGQDLVDLTIDHGLEIGWQGGEGIRLDQVAAGQPGQALAEVERMQGDPAMVAAAAPG